LKDLNVDQILLSAKIEKLRRVLASSVRCVSALMGFKRRAYTRDRPMRAKIVEHLYPYTIASTICPVTYKIDLHHFV
jgi:hypothetical protein